MSTFKRASRASANSSSWMRTLLTTTLYVSGRAVGFGLGRIGETCTGGGISASARGSSERMWVGDGFGAACPQAASAATSAAAPIFPSFIARTPSRQEYHEYHLRKAL